MYIYRQSEILKKYTVFEGISPDILAEAARRGSAVHRAIAARLLDLYCPPLPEEWQGYLVSFDLFRPMIKKVIAVEKTFVDEKLGISGTVDFLGEIDGIRGISVIDWKTPAQSYPIWSAQMAVYRLLSKADNCGTLRLDSEGGMPKMDWFDGDIQALPAFISALNAHRFFIGGK
ncbi:MAG: hypothetical protein QME78_16745 [Thermodesulfobacteriota bacterium]|nr:hypothetical protein [Thermodesulfobacteriota bacterium]